MTDQRVSWSEIAGTLCDLVGLRPVSPSSIIRRPGFWRRCALVNPKWSWQPHSYIFVDGIVSACKWNCCRTYEQSSNGNLCIWLGFAFNRGTWWEHCWCMLGDRIVETECSHDIYYGAELTSLEYDQLASLCRRSDLSQRRNARLWTMENGWRTMIPYDPVVHAAGLGRERDPITNEPKEALGD